MLFKKKKGNNFTFLVIFIVKSLGIEILNNGTVIATFQFLIRFVLIFSFQAFKTWISALKFCKIQSQQIWNLIVYLSNEYYFSKKRQKSFTLCVMIILKNSWSRDKVESLNNGTVIATFQAFWKTIHTRAVARF